MRAIDWIKRDKEQLKRSIDYLNNFGWDDENALSVYTTQLPICKNVLSSVKDYTLNYAPFLEFDYSKKYIKGYLNTVNVFVKRCDDYISDNDWTLISNEKARQEAITFENELIKARNALVESTKTLDPYEQEVEGKLPIHSDKLIPLVMSQMMEERLPEIRVIKQELAAGGGLQVTPFTPYDILGSNEMYISCKHKPPYDPTKHYFEQQQSTIDFYEEEYRKMREGVNIAGVRISPWLYFHINFFKTDLPMSFFKGKEGYDPNGKSKIGNVELRDNEWFATSCYEKAKENNKGLFIFGTRRFAKTTLEASNIVWASTISRNTEGLVIGGDDGDLKKLSKSIEIGFQHIAAPFLLPRIKSDWGSHVQFGLKKKDNTPMIWSDVFVRNVNNATSKSSEKTAGSTPHIWLVDEAGKFDPRDMYNAAIPSFQTPQGWNVVPMLSGTGGNELLSVGAQSMLNNPDAYSLIPMQWDILEDMLPPGMSAPWRRRKFGIFVPGHMSYKTGIIKDKSNLSDFLKVNSKELAAIDIAVTNWELASKVLADDYEALADNRANQSKERMYYPIDPMDCFVSSKENPYPVKEIMEHMQGLKDRGDFGFNVEFYRDIKGQVKWDFSDKEPIPFDFNGGNHDAPFIMFEEPPKPDDVEVDSTFVAGLDHYKHAKSGTDSKGCLIIYKRAVGLSDFSDRIVGIYLSRPERMDYFNEQCELILEAYGAECLQENADIDFEKHMDRKGKVEKYLMSGEDMVRRMYNSNATQNNRIGLNPSAANKRYIMGLTFKEAHEIIDGGYGEDGAPIEYKGVYKINSLHILHEMANYNGGNADALTAFGHALAWARYCDDLNIIPESRRKKKEIRAKKIVKMTGTLSARGRRGYL